MRVAIMQPTYLPWLGYFNLMAQADRFVFLDDVQFSRQSWQQRNRIIEGDALVWLSVPVQTGGRAGQEIRDVVIAETSPWRRKHLGRIAAAHARAPFGGEVSALVSDVLNRTECSLCALNISLIRAIAGYLGLDTPCVMASDLGVAGGRSERLLAMCRHLGGTRYLSPAGARDYLDADDVFANEGFPVSFQTFRPRPYRFAAPLLAGEFPSILDALAWIGPDATKALIMQETP